MEYGHSLFYFDFAGTRLAIDQTEAHLLSLSQPAGTYRTLSIYLVFLCLPIMAQHELIGVGVQLRMTWDVDSGQQHTHIHWAHKHEFAK